MARPHKQTVDYFPHYSDASTRKTLYILESKFGNDGYAFWFKLLELLASSEGHVYDVRNPITWEFLLAKTHVDNDNACKIMDLLVKLEAIDKELWSQRVIWCQNLVDNIADAYRNRLTDLPLKPNFNGQKPEPIEVPDVRNPHTILDETREDNIKEDNPPIVPPSELSLSSELNIYGLYEQEIGELTPMISEELKAAEELFGAERIVEAIRIAVKANKKQWRYISAVLENKAQGLKPGEKKVERPVVDPDKYIKGKYGHMVKR